jgi:hypothetical protein
MKVNKVVGSNIGNGHGARCKGQEVVLLVVVGLADDMD